MKLHKSERQKHIFLKQAEPDREKVPKITYIHILLKLNQGKKNIEETPGMEVIDLKQR